MAFTPTIFSDKARVLRVNVTADESDDTFAVSSINFYRTGADYAGATNAFSVPYSGGSAAVTCEIDFSTVLPPATHLTLQATFQA